MFPELENNKAEGKIYYSNSVEIFFCTSRQFNSIKMYIWIHLGFLLLMIVIFEIPHNIFLYWDWENIKTAKIFKILFNF